MSQPAHLFVIFSPKDELYLSELISHLSPLQSQARIELWCEKSIVPGSQREIELAFRLIWADMVLVLVSADLLASAELAVLVQQALERCSRGLTTVIPLLVRPVAWEHSLFGHLEPLPRSRIAITIATDRDTAWTETVCEIGTLIKSKEAGSQPKTQQPTITLSERSALYEKLSLLTASQFEELWARLGIPTSPVFNANLTITQRAEGLLQFMETLSHRLQPAEGVPSGAPATRLYFRVLNTPYFYEAVSNAESISIGRQRRKPGADAGSGNDVILRVPEDKPKSLVISRRHLEVKRNGESYFVIDHSKHGTLLNGTRLEPGRPTPLHAGDRLLIADVIGLEFLVRTTPVRGKSVSMLDIGALLTPGIPLTMEASTGDMLTADP